MANEKILSSLVGRIVILERIFDAMKSYESSYGGHSGGEECEIVSMHKNKDGKVVYDLLSNDGRIIESASADLFRIKGK